MTENLMPSLLDREIDSDRDDAFGHRHFAKALEGLIKSPNNKPPFSIGLLGKWGSGKSSIKSMYLKSASETHSNGSVFPIVFNAWRFGGENLKRALLRHVFLATGGDKNELDDALFHKLEETVKQPRSWKEMWVELYEKLLWAPAQLLLVLAGLAGLVFAFSYFFNLKDPWVAGGAFFCVLGLGWKIVGKIPELNKLLIARTSSVVRVDAPRSSAEQYEDLLVAQLNKFGKGQGAGGRGKKCERLVVFVDDLDRLSSDEMVTGLDAIRTLMEIPLENAKMGIIFVISCDEDRVAKALFRSKATNSDMPGAVFSRSDARRYLDRIFQFRVEIPKFPKRDMRNYSMDLFRKELPDISNDLAKSGVSLENVVDRMIHVGVKSPRNALQILNSFAQSWWIAKRREREGAGSERAGGLQEGAVTKHPIALAAICALRLDFPDFYHDLQKESSLIECFTAAFIRNESIDMQSDSVKRILDKYSDGDGKMNEVHGPLRQFIASLGGIRWPDSLQPLLILTQDPITRRLGDKALPLYEAFVSGDHQAILRLLGRDMNSDTLPVSDVRQLKDMIEDLEHETPVRRDHAASCLAALANRLPRSDAHHLISPVARRLAASEELRWRLGIEKIRNVLPAASPDDRRDVADRLVSDLLMVDGDTEFKRETMQPPSSDEAIKMAREACSLVLWVRSNDGLHGNTEAALLSWLKIRRISVEGKETSLPFAVLEEWLEEFGEPLLIAMKENYTQLAINVLESDELDDVEIDKLINRCRIVIEKLYDEGEESRRLLWRDVSQLASVRCQEGVALAWETMSKHSDGPAPKEISVFVAALANRMKRESEDEAEWGFNYMAGAEALSNVCRKRADDLDKDAQQAIATLADGWSSKTRSAKNAAGLMDVLIGRGSTESTTVINNWIEGLFESLPDECLDWLAINFTSGLNDQHKQKLSDRLKTLVAPENVPAQHAKRYHKVMCGFSSEALSTEPLVGHLKSLCNLIRQRHANQSDFLTRIFPVVPNIIEQCPKEALGPMLQEVFVNTKGTPELFAFLHGYMVGHWPNEDELLAAYNPQILFDEAAQIASTNTKLDSMGLVLKSMMSMTSIGIDEANAQSRIVEVACKLWLKHPETALSAIQKTDEAPKVEDAASMLNGIDPDDVEQMKYLANIWIQICGRMSDDECEQASIRILSSPAQGTEEKPDLCFHLWVEATEERRPEMLRRLLASDQLNDEQRKRAWLQIVERLELLGREFILEALSIGFGKPEDIETMRSMIEARTRIDELCTTTDQRHDLGRELLKAFVSVPSMEIQNLLIDWLKSLNVEGVLKQLKELRQLKTDELEIVVAKFPNSRYLKNIRADEG